MGVTSSLNAQREGVTVSVKVEAGLESRSGADQGFQAV
jgi:hypothetical protein